MYTIVLILRPLKTNIRFYFINCLKRNEKIQLSEKF